MAHQKKNKQNDEDQSEATAWIVSPNSYYEAKSGSAPTRSTIKIIRSQRLII